ncbi:MAG: tetratricopeptide repeat protein [Bacteroidia bacterium]|nr:tetratricopeptide repeat protein [Bacteroidia bacterium]MDW8334187.1 tetratricopeptide repeat protein [Bacteroidia bacterium]
MKPPYDPENDDHRLLVQTYMNRLAALQSRPKFTASDIEELTRELGLTDEELAMLEAYYREHLDRGRGFAKYGRWEEAVAQFAKAAAIKPFEPEVFYELGAAHKKLWQLEARSDDKIAAEKALARCLELEPRHEEAFRLAGELARYAVSVETVGGFGSGKMNWETIAGVVIVVMIVAGIVALGIWIWG